MDGVLKGAHKYKMRGQGWPLACNRGENAGVGRYCAYSIKERDGQIIQPALLDTRIQYIFIDFLQGVSQTYQDAILHQATLAKSVWDLATQVMDLYEQAKLKGQS